MEIDFNIIWSLILCVTIFFCFYDIRACAKAVPPAPNGMIRNIIVIIIISSTILYILSGSFSIELICPMYLYYGGA